MSFQAPFLEAYQQWLPWATWTCPTIICQEEFLQEISSEHYMIPPSTMAMLIFVGLDLRVDAPAENQFLRRICDMKATLRGNGYILVWHWDSSLDFGVCLSPCCWIAVGEDHSSSCWTTRLTNCKVHQPYSWLGLVGNMLREEGTIDMKVVYSVHHSKCAMCFCFEQKPCIRYDITIEKQNK